MERIASATGVPCATRTSTWRSFATISSGVCRFLPIVILLRLSRAILQDGPLQRGRITPADAKPAEFQIAERADWTLFRSLNTLPQQAGVPLSQMRRLLLKELTNNALDTGAKADAWRTSDGVYVVKDDGPGISDDPTEI